MQNKAINFRERHESGTDCSTVLFNLIKSSKALFKKLFKTLKLLNVSDLVMSIISKNKILFEMILLD